MKVTRHQIETLLNKWQAILRLQDWDIKIKIIRTKWRKSGDIKIDMEDKLAVLMVNHTPKCENLEELVLHELIHLKLWGMDQMIDDLIGILYGAKASKKKEFAFTQFMILLESTVQDLTKAFLTTAECKKPMSMNRLRSVMEAD